MRCSGRIHRSPLFESDFTLSKNIFTMLLFLLLDDVTADKDPKVDPIIPSAPSETVDEVPETGVSEDEEDEQPVSSTPFPLVLLNKPVFNNS